MGGVLSPLLFLNQCGGSNGGDDPSDEKVFTLGNFDIDIPNNTEISSETLQVLLNGQPISSPDYTISYTISDYSEGLQSSTITLETSSGVLTFDPSSYKINQFSDAGSSFSYKITANIVDSSSVNYTTSTTGYIYYGNALLYGLPDGSNWFGVNNGTITVGNWSNAGDVRTCSITSSSSLVANNLSIPSQIWSSSDGTYYNLVSIGDGAFFSNSSGLTGSLTIPSGVTSIGSTAFCKCSSLTSLSIPVTVTNINNEAFCSCQNLTGTLTIPSTAVTIGDRAFKDCYRITGELTIGSSWVVKRNTFEGCSSLTSLSFPSSGFSSVEEGTFYGCSSLTSITNFGKITNFGNSSFAGCSSLPGVLTFCSTSNVTIGEYAFTRCTNLTGVNITTTGTEAPSIGNRAFYGCTGIVTSYNSEYPVNKISYSSDNIYYLHCGIYYYCIGSYIKVQTSGTYPASCSLNVNTTTICDYAFDSVFSSTTKILSLTIPNNCRMIGKGAFYGDYIEGLTIGSSTGSSSLIINKDAFYGCSNLKGKIEFPYKVKKIGEGAFSNCTLLGGVTLQGSLSDQSSIDFKCFLNCTNLSDIVLNGFSSLPNWDKQAATDSATVSTKFSSTSSNGTIRLVNFTGDYSADLTLTLFVNCGITSTGWTVSSS